MLSVIISDISAHAIALANFLIDIAMRISINPNAFGSYDVCDSLFKLI